MDVKKGAPVELNVEKVVYGGRGIAHLDDAVVFVDRAVPGDHVAARITRRKKNFFEAKIIEVLDPSPHRIHAPCPYSGYCGGCTWQFIVYDKQLEYKQGFVEDSLRHIGKVGHFHMHEIVPSPHVFEYRNKMEFSFSDRKWLLPEEQDKEGAQAGVALGLHIPGSFYKVLDIQGCMLQEDKGNEILRAVRRYVKESGIPVYGLKSHQGFWRYLMLRHSYRRNEWMVNIVTGRQNDPPVQSLASILREGFPEIVSIVNNINTRRGGTAIGEREVLVAGDRAIRDAIGSCTYEISANSFFQTNTPLSQKLYQAVATFASLTGKETVVDLYCGIGTISIYLAPQARRVIGMDISDSAIADAGRNCRLNGVDNCDFLCGDAKTLLTHFSTRPDVLVTDPPRTGMHTKALEQIVHLSPERIIYVSCNPATLARDIELLKEYYTLKEVQPIDLFPHTFHIESVALLERV